MRGKQLALILPVLVLLVGGLALYFLPRGRGADPLVLLPEDTVALLDLNDSASMYHDFRESRLGRRIAAIPWADVLTTWGISRAEAVARQADIEALQAFADGPVFRELFATRTVLALLPPAAPVFPPDNQADPLASLVLIAQPRHSSDVLAMVSPLLAGDTPRLTESYRQVRLESYALADRRLLTVAAAEGLLIASFSKALVKRCLDLASHSEHSASLAGRPAYLELRKRAGGREQGFFYADMVAFLPALHDLIGGIDPGRDVPPVDNPFQDAALFCGRETDRLRCSALVRTAIDLTSGLPELGTDDVLRALPADLLLHVWTNVLDGEVIARRLLHDRLILGTGGDVERMLVDKAGIDLEEFVSMFGSPASCSVTGMRGKGFFPLPRLNCRFAVRDQEQLQQVLQRLALGKNLTSREAGGVRIHSLMVAGGLFQPSWAVADGQLLLADSPEELGRQFVEPVNELLSSDRFRQADVGLDQPNSFALYFNSPELFNGLRQVLVWLATLLAMTDQQMGHKAHILVQQVVDPILDGMGMFAAGSLRLQIMPAEMVMDTALLTAGDVEED